MKPRLPPLLLALIIGIVGLFESSAGAVGPEISVEQPAGTPLGNVVVGWGYNYYGQTNVPAGLTDVQAIAAGYWHTVALKSGGTVVAWGYNNSGQTSVPVGLTGVQAIAAGYWHTVALKSDGTVVAWGYNNSGQTSVPVGLTGVQAIAAGGSHTVALKSDGTVVAWGYNDYGQTNVPELLSGVQAAAAGGSHTVALKSDGTVVSWGRNDYGQINVPVGMTGVQAIAAGGFHTVALKSDGAVVAWGNNDAGQTIVPAGLTGVKAIAARGSHTVALKNDGTVVAWGNNDIGQTNVPVGLTGVQAISAGYNHTVAAYPNVNFGNPRVGSPSVAKTLTIKNTGSTPLSLTSISLVGGNASDFSVNTAGILSSIPATTGESTFTVIFTPNTPGNKTTTLRVVSDDADENPYFIQLTGKGIGAEIAVTGYGVDIADGDITPSSTDHTEFGALNTTAATLTRSYTIDNSGNADLTLAVGAITLTGMTPGDFTIGGITLPATIAAGSSATFAVTFNPSAAGLRMASVNIANNDPDEGQFDFSIQGTGFIAPEISLEQPAGTPLGNVAVAWGSNSYGQTNVPTGLTGVKAIAAGYWHTVVLKSDGTVVAWGGQLRRPDKRACRFNRRAGHRGG